MPQPSRFPSPTPPRTPRLPPLRLSPIRERESIELDAAVTKSGLELPPFIRWDRFMTQFKWETGQHLTSIGPTGSGKTVLNRYLLRRRRWVVVLGVKARDPELYGAFKEDGYQLTQRFDADPDSPAEHGLVLFVPKTDKHGAEARAERSKAFRRAVNDVYDSRIPWCVYCDDVQYLSDQLKLAPELEELWMLARSEGKMVAASSQEPVNIPVMAYSAATHLFLFKNPDLYRARRMGELSGVNREIATETIMSLPKFEFLYINKNTGMMCRSKVLR